MDETVNLIEEIKKLIKEVQSLKEKVTQLELAVKYPNSGRGILGGAP